MDISIVIPSYNTQDVIATTLTNLESQQTDFEFEIILVDCSPHDEVEKIANNFTSVHFHKVEKRFNPGIGRNIGANLAQGKLLVFIDSDVRLAANSLDNAWKEFTSGKTIFGGALELDEEASSDAAAYLEHYFFNHESQATRPPCMRANLSSALMCFDKSIFLAEGGFKDIPRMQDTELTERLVNKDYKLYFCPSVLAFQTQDSPLKKVFNKIYINGQNLYYIRYAPSITFTKKIYFTVMLPLITIAKVARIVGRHLTYQPFTKKIKTLTITPWLLAGGFTWMSGFYNAIFTEKGISQSR